MEQFFQFLISGITIGSIYALTAIGFTIIYNCTQVVNFAQGEFLMLGAMLVAILVADGVPLVIACIIAVACVTIVGCLVGATLLRPLRTGSTLSMIIITVGASILIRGIVMLRPDKEAMRVPGFTGEGSLSVAGASFPVQSLWVLGTAAVMVVLLWAFYRFTLLGRAMRASACCKEGARLVGININRMTILSFAIGAAVGAVSGIVVAPITFAQYDMGVMLGVKGFCAAIIGGMGNFTGGIIAGILLGLLESMGAGFVSSAYKDAIAFVILLLILFARPQGVFGGSKQE